jgi:hypothetical protein
VYERVCVCMLMGGWYYALDACSHGGGWFFPLIITCGCANQFFVLTGNLKKWVQVQVQHKKPAGGWNKGGNLIFTFDVYKLLSASNERDAINLWFLIFA